MTGAAEETFAATLAKAELSANQRTQTSVSLNWEKVKGAEGYEIYRKTGKDGAYKKIKTITGGKTITFKNTGLALGSKYYYKIRAYNGVSKGKYSAAKAVTLTYAKPRFTVYLPTSIDEANKTIIITLTNNSKSEKTYFDGIFAIENLEDRGRLYTARSISFEKPEKGVKGMLAEGKRLYLDPGEKVIFTCKLDESFSYDRENVRLTTCVRYKKQDYVSVYSIEDKNKIYTTQGYYDYLVGSKD